MSRVPYGVDVGSLMYVMLYTRLYISHVVRVLSKHMSKPRKEHWTTTKRVFIYLCGTSNYAILLPRKTQNSQRDRYAWIC
jgi:hypothetical protein